VAREQFGERPVQPDALAGQQIGVHGLAGEGVPERVRGVLAGDQQLPADRLAQRRLQLVLRQLYGVPQQVVLDTAPGDGGRAQHLLGGLGELLDPDEEYVGQPARHGGRRRVEVARQRGEQLLRVEGVALGPVDDTADRGVRQGVRPQRPDETGHFGVGHRPQFHAVDGGQPDQLGEQWAQGMAAVQIVRAVRGEDRQAVGGGAGSRALEEPAAEQEAEEVPGGLVRPVQVFEDQQERGDVGEVGEETGQALEELQAAARVGRGAGAGSGAQQAVHRRVRGESGGEPVVRGQYAEDLRERQVRQAHVAQVHTVAGEDGHAGGCGVGRGFCQRAGLADARVARHQYGAGVAVLRPLQHAGEPGEFVLSPDERRTECLCHGDHPGTRH
jgi:hypothetical protein